MNKPASSKFLDLKEWLYLGEVARHLTGIFGNEVTEADILHFALEGHLILSVKFINPVKARICKLVKYDEVQWRVYPPEFTNYLPTIPDDQKEKPYRLMTSLKLDDARYLNLEDEVKPIDGIWDLPMIGAERRYIELQHSSLTYLYLPLTYPSSVKFQSAHGALVERPDGVMCLLHERFEDNENLPGTHASLQKRADYLHSKNCSKERIYEFLAQSEFDRIEYARTKQPRPEYDDYYPFGRLPEDCVLVVRTKALRMFEQRLSEVEDENTTGIVNTKPNGHTERHAQNREQVLGAALHAVLHWPEECKNKNGYVQARKIAKCIENHSVFLFPETGASPLSEGQMERIVGKWVNLNRRVNLTDVE